VVVNDGFDFMSFATDTYFSIYGPSRGTEQGEYLETITERPSRTEADWRPGQDGRRHWLYQDGREIKETLLIYMIVDGRVIAFRARSSARQPTKDMLNRAGRLSARYPVEVNGKVENQLFHTLDPTTRGFEYDGRRYLVTDTVGFIRRLPTQLVEGFAATLEETLVADLVLHVADASLPEDRLAETIAAVTSVLTEIGADDIPSELVLNKVDLLDPLGRRRIEHAYPRALLISANTGEGLDALKERIAELFSDRFEDVRLLVPYSDGRTLADLYDLGAHRRAARHTRGRPLRARLPRAEAARFARYLVAGEGERDFDKVSAR
jgi:hypothetical protein